MSLPNGQYKIQHQASQVFVARSLVEDKSLLPKRIVVYPSDMDPSAANWDLESLGGSNYHLSNRGGKVSQIKGQVYANLMSSEEIYVWVIQPGSEPNVFTISNSDGGWVLPSTEEYAQVIVEGGSIGDQWIITPA